MDFNLLMEHRKEVIEQTLSRVSREIDLTMANIAALSRNNSKLLRHTRKLQHIFSELGLKCHFFNEEMAEANEGVDVDD